MKKVYLPVYLAVRAIQRGNKGTFLLTIMIVALSFVLMVFMPSLTAGITGAYNQQVSDYQYADLVIEPDDDNQVLSDTDNLIRTIERIPGISAASSHMIVSTSLKSEKKTLSRGITTIIPSDEEQVTRTAGKITEGRYLSDGDTDMILLGSVLAGHDDEKKDKMESLGGVHAGDSLDVTFQNGVVRKMTVAGIFETGSLSADNEAFITRKEMESVLGETGESSLILIRAYDADSLKETKVRLMEFGIHDDIKTVTEKGEGIIGDALKSFSLLNSIMLVFSLVIASIVIFIVVYINTTHQRRQIGILKAIGIPERDIIRDYLVQVAVIYGFGAVCGVALFTGISEYFKAFPLQFPAGAVYPVFDLTVLLPSLVVLGFVSLVAGFIPAQQATSEEILDLVNR
ncbi:ABC transporter permease [Methanospirillum purgamenti]|jgi:putative ABC transport system permease protein|uniref:ABC transporter permease n=1 Tax=Methanospirillum hungatei TaxID=2203 RepID=A0A8F5ZE91_METHU|nr:FtsX-like permease family protein [Methanospirillum hungatei]QXO94527.1 ABC transporter permease [Methanospirillum hungatei]